MNKSKKIYIAGHTGMVGSALVRKFKTNGFNNIIYKNSNELDLKNQDLVNRFFDIEKPFSFFFVR